MKYQSIVLEGGEGCGKSTIARMMKEDFEKSGLNAVFFREPGGTAIGEQIRNIILDKKNLEMTPECEMMLFAAARSQNLRQNVFPMLHAGKIVVLDRFVESSYVYQGHARGIGMDKVITANELVLCGWQPDITIFLDIEPEVAMERIISNHRETNRIDLEKMSFMHKVREGYLLRAKENPSYRIINAVGTPEEVYARVKEVLMT